MNRIISGLAVTAAVAFVLVSAAQAQGAKALSFDAASVKPHPPGDRMNLMPPTVYPGGRFVSRFSLTLVIAYAYNLPENPRVRLSGLPAWADGDRRTGAGYYDIEATGAIPAGLSIQDRQNRMKQMVQTLLADRFKLVIHRETKEMPVYALVVGKGGPKLEKADIEEKDCPDAPPIAPGTPITACHFIGGGMGQGLHGRAVDMADVANFVENWTDRPLLDKTGLKGLCHIETKGWLPMQPGPAPAPGVKAEDGTDMADVPTVFQMFERLGLKMESQNDKADTYVIDHLEKPSEN